MLSHLIQRSIWIREVGVGRKCLLYFQSLSFHILKGKNQIDITIADDTHKFAALEDRQMAHMKFSHVIARLIERLIKADRLRHKTHVFLDGRDGLHFYSPLAI